MNSIETVAVCGAGTMGLGIAQVCAAAGIRTVLYDLDKARVLAGAKKLNEDLQKLVDKGKMKPEDKEKLVCHLLFTSELSDCKAQLLIEAIVENSDAKTDLFGKLAVINGPDSIYVSNTSSLSISALSEAFSFPEKMAGLHFFNPAPLMKLVEVVKGKNTADEVMTLLTAFTKHVLKLPVVCTDAPGFIVNRVARPYYIESLRLAEETGSEFELIDKAMEAQGFRMGPFRLMDLIGNDINYAVSCSVYDQLGAPERLKPSYIQKEKVEKGMLGKKTGSGYYNY